MGGWPTFSTFTASAMTGMSSMSPTSPSPWVRSRSSMKWSNLKPKLEQAEQRMKPRRLYSFAVLAAGLGLLSACQSFREEAGLTKQSPDEFAVTTKAPLIIPPDFNLHPPSPGAAPLNQTDPTSSAEVAMFNTEDPNTVASQMQGNYSPGEKMLLAHAGVQNADPTIRAQLQSDQRNMQGADSSFTDRILGSPAKAAPQAKGATPASTDKSSGGWFDWF